MVGYGWDAYDARNGGTQTFHDNGNDIDLVTSFVKIPGGEHGGSWGLRVKGTPRAGADKDIKTTVVFYTSLEGEGYARPAHRGDPQGLKGDINFVGRTPELGNFKIDIVESEQNRYPRHDHDSYKAKPLDRTYLSSLSLPEASLWQIRREFLQPCTTFIPCVKHP